MLQISRAFTNLTADGQYASLGLMLVGCLARARNVIRPFGNLKQNQEICNNVNDIPTTNDDLGELVKRDSPLGWEDDDQTTSVHEDVILASDDQVALPQTSRQKQKKSKRLPGKDVNVLAMEMLGGEKHPKKKRKKANTFDSLFSSLI